MWWCGGNRESGVVVVVRARKRYTVEVQCGERSRDEIVPIVAMSASAGRLVSCGCVGNRGQG